MNAQQVRDLRADSTGSLVGYLDNADPTTTYTAHLCPPHSPTIPTHLGQNWVDQPAGLLHLWPQDTTPPPEFFTWLRWEATRRANPPSNIGAMTPTGEPDLPIIVQFDTWLWAPEPQLQPITSTLQATTLIPWITTNYTATVTLTPTRLTWDNGTTQVECTPNDMKPFNHHQSYYDQQTNCSITYTDPSDGQIITTQAFWEATYHCHPGCGAGTLGEISNHPTTRPVDVIEYLVVNS